MTSSLALAFMSSWEPRDDDFRTYMDCFSVSIRCIRLVQIYATAYAGFMPGVLRKRRARERFGAGDKLEQVGASRSRMGRCGATETGMFMNDRFQALGLGGHEAAECPCRLAIEAGMWLRGSRGSSRPPAYLTIMVEMTCMPESRLISSLRVSRRMKISCRATDELI